MRGSVRGSARGGVRGSVRGGVQAAGARGTCPHQSFSAKYARAQRRAQSHAVDTADAGGGARSRAAELAAAPAGTSSSMRHSSFLPRPACDAPTRTKTGPSASTSTTASTSSGTGTGTSASSSYVTNVSFAPKSHATKDRPPVRDATRDFGRCNGSCTHAVLSNGGRSCSVDSGSPQRISQSGTPPHRPPGRAVRRFSDSVELEAHSFARHRRFVVDYAA